MAKRYNYKALTEAIKQGQARMKRTMAQTKAEAEAGPAEPRKQPEREPVRVGLGTIPARRKKPLRANRSMMIFGAILIGLAALIYWAEKVGTRQPGPEAEKPPEARLPRQETPVSVPPRTETMQTKPKEAVKPAAPPTVEVKPPQESKTGLEKDHVIVIATYTKREHLLPAQEYFDKNGVKTEIMRRGSYYLLVTAERFESPLKDGSDGDRILKKIRALGETYKAPDGYENFGRKPFQDAYAMKIRN